MSSTADAVGKYLDGCTAGILQANTRTAKDALELSTNATDGKDVFSLQSKVGGQTLTGIAHSCPACRDNTALQNVECCGNGDCEDGDCRCDPGSI